MHNCPDLKRSRRKKTWLLGWRPLLVGWRPSLVLDSHMGWCTFRLKNTDKGTPGTSWCFAGFDSKVFSAGSATILPGAKGLTEPLIPLDFSNVSTFRDFLHHHVHFFYISSGFSPETWRCTIGIVLWTEVCRDEERDKKCWRCARTRRWRGKLAVGSSKLDQNPIVVIKSVQSSCCISSVCLDLRV